MVIQTLELTRKSAPSRRRTGGLSVTRQRIGPFPPGYLVSSRVHVHSTPVAQAKTLYRTIHCPWRLNFFSFRLGRSIIQLLLRWGNEDLLPVESKPWPLGYATFFRDLHRMIRRTRTFFGLFKDRLQNTALLKKALGEQLFSVFQPLLRNTAEIQGRMIKMGNRIALELARRGVPEPQYQRVQAAFYELANRLGEEVTRVLHRITLQENDGISNNAHFWQRRIASWIHWVNLRLDQMEGKPSQTGMETAIV